jgi:hypothetical protein
VLPQHLGHSRMTHGHGGGGKGWNWLFTLQGGTKAPTSVPPNGPLWCRRVTGHHSPPGFLFEGSGHS